MKQERFSSLAIEETLCWLEKYRHAIRHSFSRSDINPDMYMGSVYIRHSVSRSDTNPDMYMGSVYLPSIERAINIRLMPVTPRSSDRMSLMLMELDRETRITLSAYREDYFLPKELTRGSKPLNLEDQLTLGLWFTLPIEDLRRTSLYCKMRGKMQEHPDFLTHHLLTPAKIHFQVASDILNGVPMEAIEERSHGH